MEEKVPVHRTYHHETLGDLRTIRTGNTPESMLFCLRDVSRILDYKGDGQALRHHCKNVCQHDYMTAAGRQTVNFMTYSDLEYLMEHTKRERKSDLYAFVHEQILPDAFPKPSSAEIPDPSVMPYDAYEEILRIASEMTYLIGKLLELNQRLVDFVDVDE